MQQDGCPRNALNVHDVALRTAGSSDADAPEDLERQAWNDRCSPQPDYGGPVFGRRIPFEDVIVATLEGKLLGYVAVGRRTPFVSNAHIGVVRAIVVRADCQRQGVGKRLLAEAENEARRRGFVALRLTVMASNLQALALYRASGWVELGRYPNEFRVADVYIDDIVLGRSL